jgi:hypothetical protein
MEGAHKQQRRVSDAIIVGDKVEAAKMRRRVQHGAAAALDGVARASRWRERSMVLST